ncbi:pyridoxal phosphate-dependent decarboxylase family protein [Pseudoalteromonas fenneropenaei]|uniref:Pyridoxal phosphate-dependent decarboxylase family protein n=1 Tax=Pseudoalteromonas fenneropenaei TaxID=1737459 RepID=A0ABV7CJ87_9GAMM
MTEQDLIAALQQQLSQQANVTTRPVTVAGSHYPYQPLPELGQGFSGFCEAFNSTIAPQLSASNGPRYWGFVTGGANPVATYADWLVSSFNQNVSKGGDSIASTIERHTVRWLTELFALPSQFDGLFTTGATSANVLGALTARQFAGQQQGINVALQGFYGVACQVFSATPHASMQKALGFAGFGQQQCQQVARLAGTEAMDVADLAAQLAAHQRNNPASTAIVIASAGTVTGTDYDDLVAIAALCHEYQTWLHVDAAFGIFERLVFGADGKTQGLEFADSITLDCHKWLNVPYDCGVFLTQHIDVLKATCHVDAPYLANDDDEIPFMSLGIENSRRFRALPAFATLYTYGKAGIKTQIEKNMNQAKQLADWLAQSQAYQLLKPCELNVVVFALKHGDDAQVRQLLADINATQQVFMTPGRWQGRAAIRAAFSNWSTTDEDVALVIKLLGELAERL